MIAVPNRLARLQSSQLKDWVGKSPIGYSERTGRTQRSSEPKLESGRAPYQFSLSCDHF
jgi:hypothetical protein